MKSAEKKSLSTIDKKNRKTNVNEKESKKEDRLAKQKKSTNKQKFFNNVELNVELSMFLSKDKVDDEKLKDFTRKALLKKTEKNKNTIDNNNLMIMILKLSTLDLSDIIDSIQFPDENFPDLNLIQEVISKSSTSNAKLKTYKLSQLIDIIFTEVYFNFDIEIDFVEMKVFILNILQFSQIKYRRIRHTACLILNALYRNFIEECENSKKVQRQLSTAKQTNLLKFAKDGRGDTASKINKINQFLLILKDHYIIRRLSDVAKEIRQAVCELLTKQTKSYFLEIFGGKISNYYKFFLSDPVDSIKIKYLGLLYERIDKNIPEEEQLITKILSESRKIIINLCLKDENKLAKPAIRIIEILSEMNLLSDETVNSLLPHLFNSEVQIRNLITKVVLNTILNFSPLESKDDNKDSKDFTFENFIEVIEFFYKLSANDNNMISILVGNFYHKSEFLNRFDYFFKLLSVLLKQERDDNLVFNHPIEILISTVIKTLIYSIREMQMSLESAIEKDQSAISKNEEFINLFCINIHYILNNLMIEDIDNFNEILNLFQYFKIFDQNLVKFEERNFSEILKSLQKAFFLNYNFEKVKLNSFEILMENVLKAIQTLKNNNQLVNLNKDYKNSFERLTESLNESFITLYNLEINKKINLNSLNYQKIYTIYVQYISLLKYNNLSNTSFLISDSMFFIIRVLNHCSQNYKNLTESISNDLIERLILVCLNLGNEITLSEFNGIINANNENVTDNKIKEYVNNRANFLLFIHNLIQIPESDDKQIFYSMLNLKTKGLCVLLEIYIYSTSEKLRENLAFADLYYIIPNLVTDVLETFLVNNFLKFFDDFANLIFEKQKEEENNEDEDDDEKEEKKSQDSDAEIEENKQADHIKIIDENEESLKRKKNEEFNIIFSNFKLICESFSKLLVLNLGIFKYKNFCSLYFECFILLKMPIIIKNITSIVIERILEKELENFVELDQYSKQNNPINVIIYFLTKITIKLFSNKLTILGYREFDFTDKLNMITNLWKVYVKCIKQKKLKKKYKENINKDKNFFSNFIYNSLIMAIEQTEEVEENGKKEIRVKNIKLLEILQIFLKTKLFYEEKDYKQILVAFIKICEDLDKLDNINFQHYSLIEKFKKLLVSKAKLHHTEKIEDSKLKDQIHNEVKIIKELDHEEDEDKEEIYNKNKKKISQEDEKEELKSKSDLKKSKGRNRKKRITAKSSIKQKRNFDESGINEESSMKKKRKDS